MNATYTFVFEYGGLDGQNKATVRKHNRTTLLLCDRTEAKS